MRFNFNEIILYFMDIQHYLYTSQRAILFRSVRAKATLVSRGSFPCSFSKTVRANIAVYRCKVYENFLDLKENIKRNRQPAATGFYTNSTIRKVFHIGPSINILTTIIGNVGGFTIDLAP